MRYLEMPTRDQRF